jgi:hypothetical protein
MRTISKPLFLKRSKPFVPEYPIYKKSEETLQDEDNLKFHNWVEDFLTNPPFELNERAKSILLLIKQLGTASLQIQQRKQLNRLQKKNRSYQKEG